MIARFQRICLPFVAGAAVFALVFVSYGTSVLAGYQASERSRGRADFYVSPEGKDSWSGKLDAPNAAKNDGPFASVDRARKAVQGIRRGHSGPVVVMLRGGTYFLPAALNFDHSDSGSANAPVVYEAFPGEKPVISGGRVITGWSNTSGNVWTVKLDSHDFQKFEALFFNDERRYRPRTTDNSYLYNAGPVIVNERSPNCSQPPPRPPGFRPGARPGPGGGGFPGGQDFFQGGGFPGRRFPFPRGRRFPGGQRPGGLGERGGQQGFVCFDRFRYKDDDIAPNYHGMALGDVEVLNFEKWTMSRLRLKEVDTSAHIAYLTGPTFPGAQISGFFPNHRYLIENVKENLKKPGEWYLDRCADAACTSDQGAWTLTYLAKSGENPNRQAVIVPQLPQLIIAENLEYVTFKGLTFSHDNWMPGPEGLGDFEGGPKVPGALSFQNSSHIIFDADIVDHIQAWGIDFFGASAANQIVNSALYDIGYGAIRVGRRVENNQEFDDNSVPQGFLVENNIIEGLGRIIPSGIGTGVFVGNAHNNTVTHNEIYDLYNGAIRIGFKLNIRNGKGNAHDNMVSYNLLYNLGQGVTSDMGGVYTANSAQTGNQILNNVIHDVVHDPGPGGYGGEGLYFDQGASYVVAKNNLVYRVSQAGLFVNFAEVFDADTPQNNNVTNNIFAYFKKRLLQRGGESRNTFSFTHNIVYYDQGTIQADPGRWSCPDKCTDWFFLDYNMYWNLKGQQPEFVTSDLSGPRPVMNRMDWNGWRQLGEDTHSIIADPMFVDPHPPADNFTPRNMQAMKQIGFVPFDPKQAGRSNPVLKAPPVPPAFPLQLLDPNDF